jgi:hypothetical protein
MKKGIWILFMPTFASLQFGPLKDKASGFMAPIRSFPRRQADLAGSTNGQESQNQQ